VTHPCTPDDLADLRARLAAQEVRSAAQEAEIARLKWRRRAPRRALPLLLAALLVALVPLAMLAANPFTDLNPDSVHNANIDLIYNAGITRGCDPDVAYCPNRNVTREEMASFLARTAGLGDNPPVANALTAQLAATAQRAVTAETANSAGNANTVGGYAPSGLIRVGRSAAPFGTSIGVTANGAGGVYPEPPSAFQPVRTLSLAVPSAGFLHVTGVVGAQRLNGTGPFALYARLRMASDTTGAGASTRQIGFVEQPGVPVSSMSVVWVFPVSAGEQTVVLEVSQGAAGGTGGVAAFHPALTAIYVPFGPAGGTTLETTQP
jgi:hypothetical protein